jgi:FMN hydrolase / 5-amino-6-(5-phospho-D-ribitylamino)uracil phosphatase
MRCYIRPRPFSVLSFDLDDTLYDNGPYIQRANEAFLGLLQQTFPASHGWSLQAWHDERDALVREQPQLVHDISELRWHTVRRALRAMGLNETVAVSGADRALECFLHHRSDFRVAAAVLQLLDELAGRYRLIGITNGNVDYRRIGLGDALQFVLHPGNGLRMKPFSDLFTQACDRLQLAPAGLLHVGDSIEADVQGARLGGCQAAWLNPQFGRQLPQAPVGLLPQLELAQLQELSSLLV